MRIPKFHQKSNILDREDHRWYKWSSKQLVCFILSIFAVYISASTVMSQSWQIQITTYDDILVPKVEGQTQSATRRAPEERQSGTRRASDWVLLAKTRGEVRVAGGVPGRKLSDDRRKDWKKKCNGRDRLLALWTRKKHNRSGDTVSEEATVRLDNLFEEYSNLHRTCTHGGDMGYVSELYKQGVNESTGCKFLVVEFGMYGLGNRILWLVSAYLYALLTQRVLLIDTRSTVNDVLCDPFPGSSWQLPKNFPYSSIQKWQTPESFFQAWDAWEVGKTDAGEAKREDVDEKRESREKEYSGEDLERERSEIEAFIRAKIKAEKEPRRNDGAFRDDDDDGRRRSLLETGTNSSLKPRGPPPIFHAVQINGGWSPTPRFFCDKDQQLLDQVPWLSLNGGCLYFLPALFAIPAFRPALESLFPYRDPLTHLLRQIILPVDPIWDRVQDVYNVHFRNARRVVGMQVRFRGGGSMYHSLNDLVNERITDCALEHDLIPSNSFNSTYFKDVEENGGPPLAIFIASLHMGLKIHFNKYYTPILEWQLQTGKQFVELIQMSHYGFQAFDLNGDFQAFAELITLSLVDELLTSPLSTFGYVAQAYGGLRPLLIQFSQESNKSCEGGQSSDACYQQPISTYTCPSEPQLDGKNFRDVVPYLQPCQDTGGLQLVPPSDW